MTAFLYVEFREEIEMEKDTMSPRWLYLHGFASGPDSAKGRGLAEHYRRRGISLECLDLRIPSLEHLRLSQGMQHVRERIGGPHDRAVVFGSSLGGLTACRVAEEDARVSALVLLAPAFRMTERWRERMGRESWEAWKARGWLEMPDLARGGTARIDFGFVEDIDAVDARLGDWPDVRVPTLIIHGVGDEIVDVDLSRAWAKGKRHVRLVEVDDGHELGASLERIASEADSFLRGFLGAA